MGKQRRTYLNQLGKKSLRKFPNRGVPEFHLKKEEGRERAGGKGSPRQRETGADATDLTFTCATNVEKMLPNPVLWQWGKRNKTKFKLILNKSIELGDYHKNSNSAKLLL